MATQTTRILKPKFGIRGVIVILGGFIIHLALGSYNMFGNYSTYIISYLRNRTSEEDVRNVDALWVTGFGSLGNTVGMVIGGILDRRFGPRLATFAGTIVFCSSVLLTYFCVKVNLALVTLTYGFTSNIGHFMAYIPPVQAAMKNVNLALVTLTYGFTSNIKHFMAYIPPVQAAMTWLPERTTLASGLIVCGYGGGAFVFSQVLTAYVNPDNSSPDQIVSHDEKVSSCIIATVVFSGNFQEEDLLDRVPRSFLLLGTIYFAIYFQEEDLLDRVPRSFLLLGTIYFAMHVFGIACITNPPQPTSKSNVNGVHSATYHGEAKVGVDSIATVNSSEKEQLISQKSQGRKPVSVVLKEALSTRSTYVLWVTVLCNMFAMQFVRTIYKAYGQNFISDDHFLALTVAICSLFDAFGCPLWGLVNDRFGYKITMCCITGGFAALVGTFSFTEQLGKASFMAWLSAMHLIYCGIWASVPATFAALFGAENTGITFGLTGVASSIASITAGITGVTLTDQLGWHGMFYLSATIISIAFLATFLFNGKDRHGKRI